MRVHTIITHPGGAHKDDVLAVSLLIAEHGARVLRREPTAEELDDPGVAIVDIGGVHDATRMCFDHHHFPREHEPTCALSLVLMHLGLYDDARQLCDWLEPAEWFDSRGPKKTAEWLGVPRAAIAQLHSPVDVTLLRRFAQASELEPGETLYEFMRLVGQDLLDYLKSSRAQLDALGACIERWAVPAKGEVVETLVLRRDALNLEEPSAALARYARMEGLEATIAALIYPDRRGDGYGITRFDDHPRLDFSALVDEPDVHFAHQSGFMCKTSATERGRLEELLERAWR